MLLAFGGMVLLVVLATVKALNESPDVERAKVLEAERDQRDAEQRAAQEKEEAAERAARSAEGAARLKVMREKFRAWEYICKAHALTCTRCGELAYPIPVTADRYACPACRHQFVGAAHGVPLPPPNPDA